MGQGEELNEEMFRDDCFLCRPNAMFLSHIGSSGYALAGLGPLVTGYAVVATHQHMKGLGAVGKAVRKDYSDYTTRLATALSRKYGDCFIVEHGNMAVCGISEEGRAHCFHPHFLLIPAKGLKVEPFLEYFQTSKSFQALDEALEYGTTQGQYVLAGWASGPFHVFLPNGELPRQFARALVAEQLDNVHLASWKDHPNLAKTIENAEVLREVFGNE